MRFPKYQWQPTSEEIAAAAGLAPEQVERFDHNTSPVPTGWAADIVLCGSVGLNEYPAASYLSLRLAVAAVTGLDPDSVIPGAGADELILLAARAFLDPGQNAVMVDPTYPMYRIATAQVRGRTVSIEAEPPDFEFPVDEVIAAARDAEIVWLCVPSNPIGNRPGDEEIAAVIAATDGVVVLDAAYAQFSGDDWSPWVDRYHNLLVLHTMSKAYGLAGARVGYGLGHPDLIAALDGVRPPGSIPSLSVDLAVAALDAPRPDAVFCRPRSSRSGPDWPRDLLDLGLRVLPSTTNFLLCEVGPQGADGGGWVDEGGTGRPEPFPWMARWLLTCVSRCGPPRPTTDCFPLCEGDCHEPICPRRTNDSGNEGRHHPGAGRPGPCRGGDRRWLFRSPAHLPRSPRALRSGRHDRKATSTSTTTTRLRTPLWYSGKRLLRPSVIGPGSCGTATRPSRWMKRWPPRSSTLVAVPTQCWIWPSPLIGSGP